MHRTSFTLAVVSALALPAAAAHADTISNFDVHGHGLSLTFSLPTNPTPDGHDPHQDFYIGNLAFLEDGQSMTASDVYFYNKPDGGGFELVDSDDKPIDDLDFYGKKLFTGTDKKPVFKEGSFTLTGGPSCNVVSDLSTEDADAAGSCSYKLKITETAAAPTPEPSSLLLLGSGALGAVGALRRRFPR